MNYRVGLAPGVIDNLNDIYTYIAFDNPKRAESFVRELKEKAVKFLSIFPLSMKPGRFHEFPDIRIYPYGDYNIYYSIETGKSEFDVVIRRIRRASQLSGYED